MKTIEIKLYKFSELSDSAKQKALEKLYDINVNYQEWNDFILEDEKEKLETIGFVNPEIAYSGFWSQGDGASFTSDSIDVCKLIESQNIEIRPIIKALLDSGMIEIDYYSHNRHNNHYCHERSTSIDILFTCNPHLSNGDNICEYMNNLFLPILESLIVDLSKEIYKRLESEYDYLTSEEAIIDTIEANEYDFTEDGKLY